MAEVSLLERVQGRAARALLQSQLSALTPVLMRGLGARREGPMLHPELQLLLLLRQLIGFRSWHELSVGAARRQLDRESRMAGGPPVQVGAVRELTMQGPTGPLRLRHYVAEGDGPRPLLVFYHGGGFVLGSLDSHDQPCRILTKDAGLDVLSVDYRLAPEHPFPAAVEDALAAYLWARENASALGVSEQIAVCGDSAGANLAAVVSLLTKERGLTPPSAQLLLYPTLDRSRPYPSLSLFERGYFLSARDIAWCTGHYAGHMAEHSPQSSPLLAPDLRGVCPAFVVTAGFDPLRDEGDAYALALRGAGVVTLHAPAADMMHGFINMTGLSPACRATSRDIASRFGAFLRTCAATPVSAAFS